MAGQGVKPNGKHAAKGRTGISMNVMLYKTTIHPYEVRKAIVEVIDWTCPKCGHRNMRMRWYGRDEYYCRKCEETTDIKGQTINTHSINADIETL